METGQKERLIKAYNYLRDNGVVHTQKDVAEAMGATPPNVSSALKGNKKALTDSFLQRFSEAFGNKISYYWLLTGEGEMLNEATTEVESYEEGMVLTKENSIIFYPDLPATASNIEDMPLDVHPYFELMYIKGLEGCIAIPATGRSMEPTIHPGDIVIHQPYYDRFIQNGEVYVICTTSGQRMIKRLVQKEVTEEGIIFTCWSDNPDQELYKPFELDGAEIRALYKVRRIIPISF